VVSDDSDRNFDGNGPRTGVVVTFQVGVLSGNFDGNGPRTGVVVTFQVGVFGTR
jgi:hypothetical protein